MKEYQRESVSWNGYTDTISSIDNLCLYNTQLWERCEIYIQGYEGKNTICMLTLISNGEIHKNGRMERIKITGAESRIYVFEIHKKVSVIAAGYISNPSVTGGGASITLTGFL